MVVSFIVTSVILKFSNQPDDMMEESDAGTAVGSADMEALPAQTGTLKKLDKVVFACDAGMGSSAMGVSILRTRLQKAALYPKIEHVAVAEIPSDADVVVTNVNLAERARMTTQGKIPILTLNNFMDQGQYDRIVKQIVLAYSSSPSFLIWYFRRRMKEFLKNKLRFKSFICFKEIELR